MDHPRREDGFTEDDLVGAWECFKGDGIHGWDSRVLVFRREGGRILLEYWLPKYPRRDGALRLWGTCAGDSAPTGSGLRLRLTCVRSRGWWPWGRACRGSDVIDIDPDEGGTFLLTHPGTTAGGQYFRRTAWPRAGRS